MSKERFLIDIKSNNAGQIFENMKARLREMCRNKPVTVTLEDKDLSRSSQQNRYMHKLLGIIVEDQGAKPGHEFKIALHWLKRDIAKAAGIMMERENENGVVIESDPKPTSMMTVEECGIMIQAAQVICQNNNIRYPEPQWYGYE